MKLILHAVRPLILRMESQMWNEHFGDGGVLGLLLYANMCAWPSHTSLLIELWLS